MMKLVPFGAVIVMLPLVGKWKPQIAFIIVVFPEPLGPSRPVIEPSAILSETSAAAGADLLYDFEKLVSSIII